MVELEEKFKSIQAPTYSFQIDFKQPIDLKDEHSNFKEYQDKTKMSLSALISDKNLVKDYSPQAADQQQQEGDSNEQGTQQRKPTLMEEVHAYYFR